MNLLQPRGAFVGVALLSLVCGCTSFVGTGETLGGGSGGITDSDADTAADVDTQDPTAASASGSASGPDASTTTNPTTAGTGNSASASTTLDETTSGGGTTTETASDSQSGSSSSSSSSSSSQSSDSQSSDSQSSSTGEDPAAALGLPCGKLDVNCFADAGQECCTASQCLDTCMIPCDNGNPCPEKDMDCGHGYCLFPCDGDKDCSDWPGYACDHEGGTFCEM